MQNGFMEDSIAATVKRCSTCLSFKACSEVREKTELWLKEYNEERPHKSLGHLTPREHLLTQKPEVSTYQWS
jgi:putative transposase